MKIIGKKIIYKASSQHHHISDRDTMVLNVWLFVDGRELELQIKCSFDESQRLLSAIHNPVKAGENMEIDLSM